MVRRYFFGALLACAAATVVPSYAAQDDGFWDVYQPGPDGLPLIPIAEVLFVFDGTTKKFAPVFGQHIRAERLHVVWTVARKNYGWVTGDDRRRILSGSKVQGKLMGFSGQSAKNWFKLQDPPLETKWQQTRDRETPKIWRDVPGRGRQVTWTAPPEWTSWGGEIDPDPVAEKPRCTITATPSDATEDENVRFNVETQGRVTEATLFGERLLLPRDTLDRKFTAVGPVVAIVTVRDGNVAGECRTTVNVRRRTGGSSGLKCTIEVEPPTAAPGEAVLVTMRTEGSAEEAWLDGFSVDVPLVRRSVRRDSPGTYELEGIVARAGVTERCRASFQVR